MRRAHCAELLLLLVALALSGEGLAQGFPSRPIKFVVPWPAGGPPDAVARLVGQRIGDAMKQQVLIDNRPGANSVIGTEMVARSAPDGYTYLVTTGSHTTNAALNSKLPYDTLKDFAALTQIGESAGMVLGVHPSVPAKSVKELVVLAKAKPAQLTIGASGTATPAHISGELFRVAAGVNITSVFYKGAAGAVVDRKSVV